MKKFIFVLTCVLSVLLISENVYAGVSADYDSNDDYDNNYKYNYYEKYHDSDNNDNKIKTFERTEKKLLVNKKWKITDSNRSNVLNTYAVDASEKIYDFSDILTDSEEEKLKEQIDEFVKKYKTDLVIYTDNVSYSNDSVNEIVAADFYDYNNFGINFGVNYDGILLFRNTYEADPYYRSFQFGDAQLYINYDRNEKILDDIYNDVHNGNYYEAFSSFIRKISNYYSDGIPSSMKYYRVDDMGYLYQIYHPPILIASIIGLIVASVIVGIFVAKNKMVKKATKASEYMDKNSLNMTRVEDTFKNSITTHYTVSSSAGGGGGGHSSGGSSGGGHSGGGRHG